MTRFARAKGSKASNERTPEDATSWEEMKQQRERKIKEKEDEKHIVAANQKRSEIYKKFLEEREGKVENGWAEFPEQTSTVDKVQKKRKNSAEGEETDAKKKKETAETEGGGKKLLKVMTNLKTADKSAEVEKNDSVENDDNKNPKKKKNKKNKKKNNTQEVSTEINNEAPKEPKEKVPRVLKHLKNGKIVSVKVKVKKPVELIPKKDPKDMNEEELKIYQKKKDKKQRQVVRRKQFQAENKLKAAEEAKLNPDAVIPAKKPKEHKRRKDPQPEIMRINGREIKISYFDGYPIKEEDAKRLSQLKRDMISRGLPRSEVQIALKLERRRAEKALAREKKNVCFNCRKSGHNLSECPELADSNNPIGTVADGICFKCGSTEHTHFQCKVVKGDQYKYASCFICKEQGHISRQCPDNARGLYPKGGACKLCGDVTHLKKDCPTYIAEQESKSIGLGTIGDNIEMLDDESKGRVIKAGNAVNKVIKF